MQYEVHFRSMVIHSFLLPSSPPKEISRLGYSFPSGRTTIETSHAPSQTNKHLLKCPFLRFWTEIWQITKNSIIKAWKYRSRQLLTAIIIIFIATKDITKTTEKFNSFYISIDWSVLYIHNVCSVFLYY